MCYDVSFVVSDVIVGWGKVECSVQEVLADGEVELFYVKTNKTVVFLIFNGFKPLDHWCCGTTFSGTTPHTAKM